MKEIRLDIGGPKGNAFYILGVVSSLTTNKRHADEIREEMKKGDYNNLLRVFKEHFSNVTLYAHNELVGIDEDLYEVTDPEERALVQRDAFERIQYLLDALIRHD